MRYCIFVTSRSFPKKASFLRQRNTIFSPIPMESTDKEETTIADVAANETRPAAGSKKSVKKWLIAGTAVLLLGGLGGGLYVHLEQKEARRMGEQLVELCKNGNDWERAATLIEEGADVNIIDNEGNTPLFYAVGNGHSATVAKLIKAGADTNGADCSGALAWACELGHKDIVHLLVDSGVRVHGSLTGISSRIDEQGDIELAKALLTAGAGVSPDDPISALLLLKGCVEGDAEFIKAMLRAGLDADATAKYNRTTALMYAAMNGHTDCVKALLAAGAAVDALDFSLRTEAWQGDIAEFARTRLSRSKASYDPWETDPTTEEMHEREEAAYDQFLMCDCDPHDIDAVICSALMYAASEGHTDCVEALLAAGADVKDYSGSMALMYAIEKGHTDCEKVLRAAGADASAYELPPRAVPTQPILRHASE